MSKLRLPALEIESYPPFEGFPEEGIRFLRQLKRHNTREWFSAHRSEYESLVKVPMQSLIVALQPHFAEFAPEFDVDPRRSLFRVNRDVRFSENKQPYKTHIAAHFVVRGKQKGTTGLGYYLHIEPGEVYIGGGIYIPDSTQLRAIRRAIATKTEEFEAIITALKFKKKYLPPEGESLKRMPLGYNENHPLAEWIKMKQFYIGVALQHERCFQRSFLDDVVRTYREITPWVRFLLNALEQ
ncbi:MAG: DUF2461 domain-containing protein [Bacteroidetes bacterium]|nr:DUF2461 domain-containing protein [Bacteroidota bacterium]